MNIKKITALLCAVVMVLSLAACGSNGDKAENKHYTVGICQLVQHDALDAATKGFRDAITDALGADNVTFDCTEPPVIEPPECITSPSSVTKRNA